VITPLDEQLPQVRFMRRNLIGGVLSPVQQANEL
jgi:hypothetical protein